MSKPEHVHRPSYASIFRPSGVRLGRSAPAIVIAIATVAMLGICAYLEPDVLSVTGLTLVLSSSVPLVLATEGQMIVMSLGDLDLGIGSFVGLVTAIAATTLASSPALGLGYLLGLVAGYGVLAAFIHLRRVPSLLATLGASFVWLGIGQSILPVPGGLAPTWLSKIGNWAPSIFPGPIIVIVAVAATVYLLSLRSHLGMRIRALGSNPTAAIRAGTRPLSIRIIAYLLAGALAVAAGLMLAGQTGGGDAGAASDYMLTTIAAVVIGGGAFTGGNAVPFGAALGAVALSVIAVMLTLLGLSNIWQPAAEGLVLFLVLAGRVITKRMLRSKAATP